MRSTPCSATRTCGLQRVRCSARSAATTRLPPRASRSPPRLVPRSPHPHVRARTVTHDRGLLALATATHGCNVAALDAVNGQHSAVLVDPAGRSLRMSSTAAELVELVRSGESAQAIAERFGTSREAVGRAADELATRIARVLEEPTDGKVPGFLAQRPLISGARATRWASHATWLYSRKVL